MAIKQDAEAALAQARAKLGSPSFLYAWAKVKVISRRLLCTRLDERWFVSTKK